MTKMEWLSFNSLCHIVGVPRSTAEDWIKEFTIYIPKTQQRDDTYYLHEAIDILRFIKKCKYQNYEKSTIVKMLKKRSFPIRVENTTKNVQATFDQRDYRDNILTMMQTIGLTVSNVAAQEKAIQTIQVQQIKQSNWIKTIEKQAEEIDQLKLEIEALKQQSDSGSEYEMNKYTLARLFE